jgi:hypothetical protein
MKNSITRMYDVDPITKTVVISKTFAKRASLVNSTEFEHMKALREEYADYSWTYRVIKKKDSKTTYKNMTYKNMKKYLIEIEGNDSESITRLGTLIKAAKIQPSPYAYVKKWFLSTYPDYKEFSTGGKNQNDSVDSNSERKEAS